MKTNFNIYEKLNSFVNPLEFPKLLHEVWTQIPEEDQQVIWQNIAYIHGVDYTRYNEKQQLNQNITTTEAGRTTLYENTELCVVYIDGSRTHKDIKISIAHELAHVFYNYPKKQTEKQIAEDEAKDKAREWGFVQP